MVPAGVLGFAMYSILMFEAGHTTDATNLSLIAATAPVFMEKDLRHSSCVDWQSPFSA